MIRLNKNKINPIKAGQFILEHILAPICLSCRTMIDHHGALCGCCWSQIKFIDEPVCSRLGTPLPFTIEPATISAAAAVSPPIYCSARVTGYYEGLMRDLIHRFKFSDCLELKKLFSMWLIHAGRDLLNDTDMIVPVPLNRWRYWSRRYNQSAVLAHEISRKTKLPYSGGVLKRIRNTRKQIGLTAKQRQLNVAGAFRAPNRHQKQIRNKRILLIDDVITTGATVEACTRALLLGGADKVNVLALARVVHPQQLSY